MDPRAAVLAAEAGLSRITADPIAAFRFSGEKQRRFVKAFHRFSQVYLRTSNQFGKTHLGAHFFVALMRGLTRLDGEELPLLGVPVSGIAIAQGREMAKESVIKAVLRAIGDHPHHLERNGNAIAAVWVRPDASRSDDWHDWSVMRFFVEDGQSVAGMRLDFAWADEPPKWEMWREVQMRGKANRPFLRAITATPIDIRTWRPLREDFKGCQWPHGKDGRVEIRASIYDNKTLSKEHIRQIERDAERMGPLKDAVLHGEYVNAVGANPFDKQGLRRWGERCRAGERVEGFTPGGTPYAYEKWEGPTLGNAYFVVADPSAGIEDDRHEHDPAGIVVVSRVKPYTVVARYNGYVESRDLGWLAARLAREYSNALLVWERNSGYGESFYHGLGGYGNVYVEYHEDARGLPLSQRIGWTTTATTRGTIIGALQDAVKQDGLVLYSADAVESLGSVVLKRDGLRPEAGAGAHDEDMIVLGLACHLLATIPYYPPKLNTTQTMEALGMIQRQRTETWDDAPADF